MKRRMSPWGASFGSGRSSDRAAMASGSPDVSTNQEPAEVQEECSGKKKSKFQTFKRFFARKKRKEPSPAGADAGLKASQSTDNVSKASENNTLTRSEKDKGSGSKISLGSKALSHDSVFVSDSSEANEALGASQDSIHGKVKSLQLQLKQAIRLGSPPSLMCVKKAEDVGTMSEDDGLPCSPPEYTTHHTVMNQAQMNSSISLEGIDSDDEQLSHAASSRAMSPLVVPGDFSLPASPFGCLDNSAAKHKLGLRHKACNRRKPTSRPEGKAEGDSAVEEMLTTSMEEVETDGMEEPQQQLRIEDVGDHQLKPKVEKEEEEEDEVEETEPPQHSRRSLLRDKEEEEEEEEEVVEEEEEEGEDEPETEQDVSHGPDTSCPPEPRLSEEEASESQPLPSSEPSSRASSLDSPRATPEPPTGLREYLLDPPGFVYGADKKFDSDSASESEEDGVQGTMEEEEETSLLQEVLSSLKTPLGSLDVKTEDVFLEMKQEAEGKLKEEAEIEEGEEVKEEEAEEHQPISYQFTPSCSVLSSQATEEEEEVVTRSYQKEVEEKKEEEKEEEVVAVEEVKGEEAEEEEEKEEEEEEDVAVEQLTQHGHEEEEGQKEDAEEVQPEEESSVLTRQTISQAAEEEVEEEREEGEEEAIELEKESEVEEEAQEKTEEEEEDDDDGVVAVEVNEGRGVEEAEEVEEAMEEEKSEAEEMLPDAQEEAEVQSETSMQEADEGVVLTDDGVCGEHNGHDDEIPADLSDQVVALVQEEEEKSNKTSGDEIEDGEEEAEDGEEISPEDKKQEEEEEVEANQTDETEQDLKQESVEPTPHADVDPSEATEQASVSSRPPSLSLPESPSETRSPASGPTTPSKTSVIHINLISPSSEKAISFFQTSPTKAEPSESVTQSPPADPTEETEMDLAGEEEEEEEKEPAHIQDAAAPASAEEEADRLPFSSDQSKARFNVSPAWQRPQSLTPPSSPPASSPSTVAAPSSEEVEEAAASKKVELVLSPSKMRSAVSVAGKPQNSATPAPVKPQTSAPASTEESSPAVEGSNPFGVRLRKTSGMLRLGSEEENTEPPVESPTPPTSTKVDPPQPVSVKPSVYQPISNKPVVPKKPEVHGEGGGKLKRVSDPATGRGASAGTNSPSWISMAKQKQKIYKENSLEEITVKKEEQERKSSLPMYVGLAASREHSNKTAESSSKVSKSEISKPSASAEKEAKRALSPPTPVPPQPSKSQSLSCPVAPKPQVPAVGAKHPPQPNAPQRSVPPPTPVPVPQKPPSCTGPPSLSKPATPPKTPLVTSPPFSSRPVPEKPGAKAAGLSGQTPSPQRGLPSPSLPQDEPPWMALAKKKAKAWSEMPQIVQ
ncbi:titin isoform X2 [Mugil cephalus]|uniref:titin isoform X2 n=1 Tax=Mugil cephalus TaxID=48193 RepID=UPI001FB5F39C|nr:titin isoform X2 [Mugil cephalus]